jgi:hypothetical protein
MAPRRLSIRSCTSIRFLTLGPSGQLRLWNLTTDATLNEAAGQWFPVSCSVKRLPQEPTQRPKPSATLLSIDCTNEAWLAEGAIIALVDDGAMQMKNMAELITIARYWCQWNNPRWI